MKAWHLLLIAAAVWFLFLRKRGASPMLVPRATSPHPAQPLTANQQIAVAAVKSAPAIAKAIGSFFSSNDDESSVASSEDEDDEDA